MRIVTADEINTLVLGYQGENNATQVQIPVTGWTELYGAGTFELLHQRPGDPDGYFVFPDVEDEIVKWSPSSSDLAQSGVGRLQLRYIVNGTIAKSVIYPTEILQSLDDSATPPEPWESWVDEVIQAAEDAQDAKEAAEDAQEAAEDAQEAAEDAQNRAEAAQAAVEATSATASVDDQIGTPSVVVTKTIVGDPEHVNLDFAFHNLKGEKGDPGTGDMEKADYDPNGTVLDLGGIPGYVSDQIAGKADKVNPATAGDLAALDANGNLTDSGISKDNTDTASGAIASFTDPVGGVPLKDLLVQINPVQSGSGDPTPTNVRPISGWTGAKIYRNGKNLLDIHDVLYGQTGITYSNGVYSGTATAIKDAFNRETVQTYIRLLSQKVSSGLRFSITAKTDANVSTTGNGLVFQYRETSGSSWTNVCVCSNTQTSYATQNGSVGLNHNLFRATVGTGGNNTWYVSELQLEIGDTATQIVPYNGTTYTIDWTDEAGTVYGGTLDVTTGVLTVTHKQIDLSSLSFSWSSTLSLQSYSGDLLAGLSADEVLGRFLCEKYKPTPIASFSSRTANNIFINTGNKACYVVVDQNTTPSGLVVVGLATPQTYQLTPTEVKTLLGTNNIFANTGNVDLIYYKGIAARVYELLVEFGVIQ